MIIDGIKFLFIAKGILKQLAWAELNIDIVIESTGFFTKEEDAEKHINAGAKTVVLSGPSSSPDVPTVVHGVNIKDGQTQIFSCASCTTNNISPIIEIIGRRIGIKKAIMTTIHADTSSNSIVDAPSKKNFRMGRSGLNNLFQLLLGQQKRLHVLCQNMLGNLMVWQFGTPRSRLSFRYHYRN